MTQQQRADVACRDPFFVAGAGNSLIADPFLLGDEVAQSRQQGQQSRAKKQGRVIYGPDGRKLEENSVVVDGHAVIETGAVHHGVELGNDGQGWYLAENTRREQEMVATRNFNALRQLVVERTRAGMNPDGRWINDPMIFALPAELMQENGIVPFPPDDEQFFIGGIYNPETSKLKKAQVPNLAVDDYGNSTWVRLCDYGSSTVDNACYLFDDTNPRQTHYGRVYQGQLDTGYIVEALNAITLRPKLARSLFYCWDTTLSIFIARIFKNGVCMRVELDDFVPSRSVEQEFSNDTTTICCRSEHFPYVLWPSLVEKAYAKIHTVRSVGQVSTGGWEAIGGGGQVEEALADLTGGVAGRFKTSDVTADRLFIYLYDLQRDTLFVCRPHEINCEMHGVGLNPYYPYAVNRAVDFEGRLFVQVFCAAPGLYDGGLQDISVPWALINSEQYPEKSQDGFFWMSIHDFHCYFDVIFECRLVNSGDVGVSGMPPPRIPSDLSPASRPIVPHMEPASWPARGPLHVQPHTAAMMGGQAGVGFRHRTPEGVPLAFFEWVFACPSAVGSQNEPEFQIQIPEHAVPCEIVASVDQCDPRAEMATPDRAAPVPILLKVYEAVDRNRFYSKELVCRSNWIPVRDSMVCFCAVEGCEFRVVAEFPNHSVAVDRLIFRCYASMPGVQVTASTSTSRHSLVEPIEQPKGVKWSLVGAIKPDNVLRHTKPDDFDAENDCLRQPKHDFHPGLDELGCVWM